MKIEEQKKAVRSGYDMDIIPSDLATFGNEAKNLLQDLQSRNERMFLLTFLVVNMADTKRKLENDIFAAAGIAQKYNCALTRLDYQQEAGLMSSIPLGENLIPIQRGLTTSSTAIFIPFITQELFQTGAALYYGLNALSNNMILCDRKQLKNPNGFNLGNTGQRKILCGKAGNHKCLSHYRRRYFYLRPGSRVFCPCKAAWRASDTLIPDRERHGRYTPVREPYGYEPQLQRGRQPSCTEK